MDKYKEINIENRHINDLIKDNLEFRLGCKINIVGVSVKITPYYWEDIDKVFGVNFDE